MIQVKICGLTSAEDAKVALDAGADLIGLNFLPASPRFLTIPAAQVIVRQLPASAKVVGVFANQTREEVEQVARGVPLDVLQFHGDESVEYCEQWNEWEVIKAFRISESTSVAKVKPYSASDSVDRILMDTYVKDQFGGTGREISDAALAPFEQIGLMASSLLAGGLNPENVAAKVARYRPFGVDVASGVEADGADRPGAKDPEKIRQFIERARGAEGS